MEQDKLEIDVQRMFVRLIERRSDGFVEFEFAIGEPELYVELMLPAEAYQAFCVSNRVIQLEPRHQPTGSDWDWNLRQAGRQRFR